jgi:tRNA-dihydrouridine synthase
MVGRAHYGAPWTAGAIAAASGAVSHVEPPPGFVARSQGDCLEAQDRQAMLGLPVGRALADYAVSHYEDMLSLYGVESGLRQARKHLGWYLDRHASSTGDERRRLILTSFDPKEVVAALRAAFSDGGETPAGLRSAA